MHVIIRRLAAGDIKTSRVWYERQRQGLGSEFFADVKDGVARIADKSLTFPIVYRDIQRVLLKRFPYALFYKVEGDQAFVLACMHARQDSHRWQSRS